MVPTTLCSKMIETESHYSIWPEKNKPKIIYNNYHYQTFEKYIPRLLIYREEKLILKSTSLFAKDSLSIYYLQETTKHALINKIAWSVPLWAL